MFAVILALTFAADIDPEPPGVPVKILAQAVLDVADTFDSSKGGHLVLRSRQDLYKVMLAYKQDEDRAKWATVLREKGLSDVLKRKEIDWDREMILVASLGITRVPGHRVEVLGVSKKGNRLVVSWKLHEPKQKGGSAWIGAAVLVPAHKGKVVFEQVK